MGDTLGVDFGYDPGTTPATFFAGPGVNTFDFDTTGATINMNSGRFLR